MDRYKIPKEYEECVSGIEKLTGRYLTSYTSTAILREVKENTSENNPSIFREKFMEELRGKSYYFIKAVTIEMLTEAEMYCNLNH